jgi:predicted GNAT family acetyltransferase
MPNSFFEFVWLQALPVSVYCLGSSLGTAETGMEIVHQELKSGGRYVATVEGNEAEISYSRASPRLIIVDHTGVPDALRGKGVGQALALHTIEEARRGGWKIMPLCPFFRAQVERHPEWRDVISG